MTSSPPDAVEAVTGSMVIKTCTAGPVQAAVGSDH
jgi:hypothetical protein